MDVAVGRLWAEVAHLVRTHGIASYVAAWPATAQPPPKDVSEIQRRVQLYHRHSHLVPIVKAQQPPVGAQRPVRPDLARLEREQRRPPEFTYDTKTGIGTIKLFVLYGMGIDEGAFHRVKQAHTVAIQEHLDAWSRAGLRGLCIDLRKHHGGTMWPTLYGFDRFFEGGVPWFAWTDKMPSARKRAWLTNPDDWKTTPHGGGQMVRHDAAKRPTIPLAAVNGRRIPIAVLLGAGTYSAGELVAAAFTKKENVRTFGSPTGGGLSGNQAYSLKADAGYELILTRELVMLTDGSSKQHLTPDVLSSRPMASAMAWLNSQAARHV